MVKFSVAAFRSVLTVFLLSMFGFGGSLLAQPAEPAAIAADAGSRGKTQMILAASWQPGFCETRHTKPECRSQTADRYDASHFALHGLWKMRKTYCGVDAATQALDKGSDWTKLPEVAVSDNTRKTLGRLMPGIQSGLDRHEWIKHGTCTGLSAEAYFGSAIRMLDVQNGSAVQALFAKNLGQPLAEAEIKQAFAEAFGPEAGERVKMRCARDADRRVITELTIGLSAGLDTEVADTGSMGRLITQAGTTKFNCPEGIVDAAGLQ